MDSEKERSVTERLAMEAGELIEIFVQSNGITAWRRDLGIEFFRSYCILKVKWRIEDYVLLFTEIAFFLLLWFSSFSTELNFFLKAFLTIGLHVVFKTSHQLKEYRHGVDAANVLEKIIRNNPNYISKEEPENGGDKGPEL